MEERIELARIKVTYRREGSDRALSPVFKDIQDQYCFAFIEDNGLHIKSIDECNYDSIVTESHYEVRITPESEGMEKLLAEIPARELFQTAKLDIWSLVRQGDFHGIVAIRIIESDQKNDVEVVGKVVSLRNVQHG